ncbi:MAG: L-threonylcarbamoyladenylate synthase [Casimicrobiaceae bacterium]|nr:L-threonylcarbamoyladenylate synthase [Casimicrobiaceae bacterium]MCX8097846.1 L-threonylcarbamoyladenylate synthase [Casimicrobiaceae bacterium]MDW8311364.1 L-threonylcarbamoyladenylate synthase [Burkholderiales bacterium]
MTRRLTVHAQHPQRRLIRQAAEALRAGGVIAYPTDSAYALGCALGEAEALVTLRRLRGVDEKHHLTLVCSDLSELGRYARVDNKAFRILKRGVPGPYTFILPGTRELPKRILHPRRSTIGLRVPDHPVVQALLAELGAPILSTTLILPGDEEPLVDPDEIAQRLPRGLSLLLDAGPCAARATTVIDLSEEPFRIVRNAAGSVAALGL